MEFGQQPYFPIWDRKFSGVPPGALQTYGAQPVNKSGERILEKYFPGRTPQMVNRTQFGYAMAKEALEGRGPVRIDLRHLSDDSVERIRKVLPADMRVFDGEGIDLRTQQLEAVSVVAVWYANIDGGIKTNINGESSVPGLLAAGACAHEAINYADSSGLSQAGCYASGYRAGETAGRAAQTAGQGRIDHSQVKLLREKAFQPLGKTEGRRAEDIYTAINKVTLPAELSFFKHERRIRSTLTEVRRVQKEELPRLRADDVHELVKTNEAKNFAEIVEIAYQCALKRKESRLCHYREEFPYRDDVNWLKWSIARKTQGGTSIEFEPLPIDSYPVKLPQRSRIPSPIQVSLEKISQL
jgi:succinate dehydrogenase / fumarate reductase flavoprotein subunit